MSRLNCNNDNELQPINTFLKQILVNKGITRDTPELKAVEAYNNIQKPMIKDNSRAISLKNGTLFVNVREPIYAQHLNFQEPYLIEHVNKTIGVNIVKKIKFKLGEITKTDVYYDNKKTGDILLNIDVEANKEKNIAKIVENVEDDVLKSKLAKLFNSNIKALKYKNNP